MEKLTYIILSTFKPQDIFDFLIAEKDSIRPFEVGANKTGHKSKEHGDGVRVIIATENPNQMLEFLKTGGAFMVPYYKSICPNGHLLYSNARMYRYACPHGTCGEKIAEEHFYDSRTDTAWPAPPIA